MMRWLALCILLIASVAASYAIAGFFEPDGRASRTPSPAATAPQGAAAGLRIARQRLPRAPSTRLDPVEAATLDDALAAALLDEEIERWYDGLHLVTSLRVYQFSFTGCAIEAHTTVLRVRWQTHASEMGLRLDAPTVLTTLPQELADCVKRALSVGMRVDPLELGGGLADVTVPLVLDIPTVLTTNMRVHVDALDALVAERRGRGLPANARVDAAPAP